MEALLPWDRVGEGEMCGDSEFESEVLDSEGKIGDLCGLEWRD